MKPEMKERLELWAHHALRQIPGHPAPDGFSADVMDAIRRLEARPWHARPWLEWNAAARAASLVALGGLGYVVFFHLIPAASGIIGSTTLVRDAATSAQTASVLGGALTDIGRAMLTALTETRADILATITAVFAVAWAGTLGLGTACWRLAREERGN
jgi:hypothetical protein